MLLRLRLLLLTALVALPSAAGNQPTASQHAERHDRHSERPNFLLVVFEDLSPRIGAYGDPVADTPVLDAFAEQATVFTNAFTTAGVCAPSRAALIMGVPQQSIGAQHMRTSQGVVLEDGTRLPYVAVPPPNVKAFPELLRAAGYYTTNNFKTDYQLGLGLHAGPFTIWDEHRAAHPWRGRAKNQPFFAMHNIMQTHESYLFDPAQIEPSDHPFAPTAINMVKAWQQEAPDRTDPNSVVVPGYLPDTPKIRRDIARQYDNLHFAERELGRLLEALTEEGLADNTIVVVTSDHGDGLPRAKRSLYDSGLRVPLMVRWPQGKANGSRNHELVSFLDLAPTLLSLARVAVPTWMTGRVFLGNKLGPERAYVYAALDRHDEVSDLQRAIRDARWKYIRNEEPNRAFFRPLRFRDLLGSMRDLWQLHKHGKLPPSVAQYFQDARPREELYDTWNDPDELNNLAQLPAAARELRRLRLAFARHDERSHDWSKKDELTMVQELWDGLEQPTTAAPVATVDNGRLALASSTIGASIGYRTNEGPWRLYTEPISLTPGTVVEAKAIRYGSRESATTSVSPQQ